MSFAVIHRPKVAPLESAGATCWHGQFAGTARWVSLAFGCFKQFEKLKKKKKKSGLAAANARSALCESQGFVTMERRRPSPPWTILSLVLCTCAFDSPNKFLAPMVTSLASNSG